MQKNNFPPIPGNMSKEERLKQMIRVDHAGEYGAVRIYKGQIDALKNHTQSDKLKDIEHMAEQELVHLETFEKILVEKQVRPTALLPIWHMAGYALGYVTAKMSPETAMACTEAIEEVIDEHYADQLEEIDDSEKNLKKTITKFREEEIEHRDLSREKGAEQAIAYPFVKTGIRGISKIAIWLSEKV